MKWLKFLIILIASFIIPLIVSVITWVKIIGNDLIEKQFSLSSMVMIILVIVGIYVLSIFVVILIYNKSLIKHAVRLSREKRGDTESMLSGIKQQSEGNAEKDNMVKISDVQFSVLLKKIENLKLDLPIIIKKVTEEMQDFQGVHGVEARRSASIIEKDSNEINEVDPKKIYQDWLDSNMMKLSHLLSQTKSPEYFFNSYSEMKQYGIEFSSIKRMKNSNIAAMTLKNPNFKDYLICFPIPGYPLKGFERMFNSLESQFLKKVIRPALIHVEDEKTEDYELIRQGEIK